VIPDARNLRRRVNRFLSGPNLMHPAASVTSGHTVSGARSFVGSHRGEYRGFLALGRGKLGGGAGAEGRRRVC